MAEDEKDALPIDKAMDHLAEMLRAQLDHTHEVIDTATRRRAEIGRLSAEQRSEELVTTWNEERQELIRSINDPWERIGVFMGKQFARHERQPERADIHALSEEIYQLGAELSSVLWSIIDESPLSPTDRQSMRPRGDGLPPSLPQQTFQEMRNLGIALSDGPSRRRWQDVDGEVAMVHSIPGQPMHVRLSPSSMLLAWWSGPPTHERLRAELKEAGAPAVLLAHVAVALLLERGKVTVSLAELRHAIGWTRRESDIVHDQLQRVWRMLLLVGSMPVIGKRNETYRDKRTRKTMNLVSEDPLLVVRGLRRDDDPGEATDIPHDVALDAGAWIDQYRGNRAILTDFGDVLQLARIPAGKPSGAWAQSVGLALNQRWRERSASATVATVGEDSHQTIRFRQPFTRDGVPTFSEGKPPLRIVATAPLRA